jgi:hypothetical protein
MRIATMLGVLMLAWSLALPGSAGAFYLNVFDAAPWEEQEGIEEVIHRLYQGVPSVNMYASIARFDTADHAAQGLDELGGWILAAFITLSDTEGFEPVETPTALPGARVHFALLDLGADSEPYGETTLILAQDDVYLYTVAVNNSYSDGVEDISLEAAVAMLDAIAATPAGEATPGPGFGEPATSGTWAKLPPQEHEVPQRYGITHAEDTVYLAPAEVSEEVMAIYGSDGVETVVARTYERAEEFFAYVEIAEFDDPARAEAVFAQAGPAQVTALGLDELGLEEGTADVPGDAAVSWAAEVDGEGGTRAVTVILARSGPYIVTVVVVADAGQDVAAFATDLTRAILEAEPGAGEARYVSWGMSTGGVWDKLPLTGDEILRGMVSEGDHQLHPADDDGF